MYFPIVLGSIIAIFSMAASNSAENANKLNRYTVRHESETWDDARSGCWYRDGVTFAHIETIQDVNDLQEELPIDSTKKYWIGGYFDARTECENEPFQDICWKWDDFNVQPYLNLTLINFSEAAKASLPSNTSALLLAITEASLGLQLEHQDQSELHSTICDYKFREPIQPPRTRTPTARTTTPILLFI